MSVARHLLRLALAALLAAVSAASAHAVPWTEDPREGPYFAGDDGKTSPLALEGTRCEVDVSGVVARVHLTQTYANHGAAALDARYVFPLSTRAAVFGMTMRVGARRIVATIEERASAQKIYEAAAERGQTAALVSETRENVFETRVANIGPAERVVVELDYLELLRATDAVYELVIPAAVGPRYVGAARDADWATAALAGMGAATWAVDIAIEAGLPVRAVTSPSHLLRVTNDADGVTRVGFGASPDRSRDLVVRYALTGDAVQAGVLRFEGERESWFLAMIEPPERVPPASVLPRELIFVVDVSGSMWGFPMETTQQLIRDMIASLHPWERFDILTFEGSNAVLSPEILPATPANKARATAFMGSCQVPGGGALRSALQRAYALPEARDAVRSIVLVTDGFVNLEPEVLDLARANLGRANLFAFGIGTGVNRALIEALARVSASEPFVVQSAEYAADAATAFRRYLDAPILTDVRASLDGVEASAVEPALDALPDVLADRPVVILGKYRGQGGRMRLYGRTAGGPWSQTVALDASPESPRHSALALLWARERIARLVDAGGITAEAEAEVRALGLEHHLVTPYTSFVAVRHTLAPDGAVTEEARSPLVPTTLPPVAPANLPPAHADSCDTDGDGKPDVNVWCPQDPTVRRPPIVRCDKFELIEYFSFAVGSAALEQKEPNLDALAEMLVQNRWVLKVEVRGHTDSTEARGARAQRLAEARAHAVIAYLVGRGVSPERLIAKGYGPDKPIDDNKTRAGRAHNRRVDFSVLDSQGH